jgi:hypothetical protein
MIRIKLFPTEGDLIKSVDMLEGVAKQVPSVISNAVNRALEQGRTAAVRSVTKEYTVKARTVRATLKMKRAKKGDYIGELTSKGRRLPLRDFKHSPASGDTTGANHRQIRVAVKHGAMKPLDNAFIWRGRIFQRLGANRLPIEQKYSNAVPVMLNNPEVVAEVQDVMQDALSRRLDYEIKRTLDKAVK